MAHFRLIPRSTILVLFVNCLLNLHGFSFVSCSFHDDQQTEFSGTAEKLLKSVQSVVGKLQDYVGDDVKGCTHSCPNGLTPTDNPHHKPSSNGCGPAGLQFGTEISIASITKCCDKHDVCYDTCNQHKSKCDKKFKTCLLDVCTKARSIVPEHVYVGCKSAADMMYAGTVALGCKSYKDAQANACVCKRRLVEF